MEFLHLSQKMTRHNTNDVAQSKVITLASWRVMSRLSRLSRISQSEKIAQIKEAPLAIRIW